MTLLEWVKLGRKGKFRLKGGSWIEYTDRYLFYTGPSSLTQPPDVLIRFENLRELCHYLGHEAHEIAGKAE